MPNALLTRRHALATLALLLLLLAVASRFLLHAGTATRTESLVAPVAPPATPAPIARVVVDVVGAVKRPGLYRLAQGTRIADAVARAGGFSGRADRVQVNLAAPLADGEQVVVPERGAAGAAAPAAGGASSGPVHLSTATAEQLDALPGVGPVTAQKILGYRMQHGAFTSLEELDAIPGIGPARIDQLRGLVVP